MVIISFKMMFMLNWVWLEFLNSVYTYSPPAPRHVEVLSSLGVLAGQITPHHPTIPADCLNLLKILLIRGGGGNKKNIQKIK